MEKYITESGQVVFIQNGKLAIAENLKEYELYLKLRKRHFHYVIKTTDGDVRYGIPLSNRERINEYIMTIEDLDERMKEFMRFWKELEEATK